MERRLEREIELIENDESMTREQKNYEIKGLEIEYREMARESAERAYDDEYNKW